MLVHLKNYITGAPPCIISQSIQYRIWWIPQKIPAAPWCTPVLSPSNCRFNIRNRNSSGPNFPTMNQPRLFLGFNPHSSVVFNPKAVQRWLFQPPKPPGAAGAARCSARPRRPKTRRRGRPPPAAPRWPHAAQRPSPRCAAAARAWRRPGGDRGDRTTGP